MARFVPILLVWSSFLPPAFAESGTNPYDTAQGYYNTKGAYSNFNSADVQARVNGQLNDFQIGANAAEQLGKQRQDRIDNTANCANAVDCHVRSDQLPTSFADAVQVREETYQGGAGNTGLVGLDEKLVEVEKVANYGVVGATTAAGWIDGELQGMHSNPSYQNPNSERYHVMKALEEEKAAQERNANVFGITRDWATRGYRQLLGGEDNSLVGNGSVPAPNPGTASVAASAAGTPGEIADVGNHSEGKGTNTQVGGSAEASKVGAPGDLSADPLQAGRQIAYDMLKAGGFTPVGSLREVGIARGDLPAAGEMSADELKKAGDLTAPKSLSGADGVRTAGAGAVNETIRGKNTLAEDEARGAKVKKSPFRSVTPYLEDDEPPAQMLKGLTAAQQKDLRLKWRLFRLTQERERVLTEAGPMIARLRSLGVKTLTQGQSIFQMASRNYRTFDRWRAPVRKSTTTGAVKRAPLRAMTAQR